MNSPQSDKVFAGSVPALYNAHLVPLIFESYAEDLARRIAARPVSRVLEIAAGTGVVTRKLALSLPANVAIVASDVNQPMLDMAVKIGTSRPVEWRQADAMQLPFEDGEFDAVVCQFGAMFFPEKAKAFSEARRVLGPGGCFVFSVWDRLEENDFAHVVNLALASFFPDDPPRFMARTPHGYHDFLVISRDLQQGGFLSDPVFETVAARSKAASSHEAAFAYCQGTPLRNEIEARDSSRLVEATEAAERAIRDRFGSGPVDGKICAHIVSCQK